ncbi:heavy metal translocatin [Tothia fuscella]|uniref:Heavy metal translocatin n=1 Tax=Tothia fuscella TaxID=1048955 RepID=A0A9P4P2Y9_9PEZI|nr:heavy metal translocatin [Tothia fuscella]
MAALNSLVHSRFFICNLHCPTCVKAIEDSLHPFGLKPEQLSISIITHSVTVRHDSSVTIQSFLNALDAAGFDIHSVFTEDPETGETRALTQYDQHDKDWADDFEDSVKKWREVWNSNSRRITEHSTISTSATTESSDMGKKRTHAAQCAECRAEADFVVVERALEDRPYHGELSIVGMTCSACVASVTRAVEQLPYVRSINVSLLTNSASIIFDGKQHGEEIVQTIEDAGFDATMENLEQVKSKQRVASVKESDLWRAHYAIGGMTCSACSNSITSALKLKPWIENIDINLISNSGSITFGGKGNLDEVTEAIEDAGFDASLDSVENVGVLKEENVGREVFLRVLGIYCHHCTPRILDALRIVYGAEVEVEKEPTKEDPIMKIKYIARSPVFTIRQILNTINAVDPALIVSIYHPPTIEDLSQKMHARERRRILLRLALAITAAIPAFIIGIVCMQLLMARSDIRMYMMHPIWAGTVSRAEWALFILATPIYFFAADTFHRRAMKEIKALWRPGSRTPLLQRFYRFGSMNMLMSLGTSIAYFSSIAELAIAATQPMMEMDNGNEGMPAGSNYFDSVIFLTMFLLLGRFIEAYSKAKTGDAVTSLGKLRPSEAILIEEADVSGRKFTIDLLDVGDVVRVPHGSSPPFDGVVTDGSAKFDESSLTGESRPVQKDIGDAVFAGTVNKGGPVSVRLTSVSGNSMLDNIIKIVREGQTRRAPIERAADSITSHFVPFVVAVGTTTWIVWLALGFSGALPHKWVEDQVGGWALWSLRFSIAVFVVACPCGIGLAAPTALFVGGGMAAKNGILVKGGGEAFQEASTLDCIVFDKTGTLTQGGDPAVTDYKLTTDDDQNEILGMVKRLEENSSHPVAKAVVDFCAPRSDQAFIGSNMQEIPGRGMSGSFRLGEQSDVALEVQVIVGNEVLMHEHDVEIDSASGRMLQYWKGQGRSVVLVAVHATDPFADPKDAQWTLSAMFAIADPLRPEAKGVVAALQARGVSVWMLSGDNQTTAAAVAEMVGIHADNIIAGVLPDQKADKIQWLQKTLPKPKGRPRAAVAMVGDGINDSPALTMADVGIAIGSGSDVAISSAEFILIKSDLRSLLTLIDLSRVVFRRVWFNFVWALVYNVIAMPVAAGVFFAIVSKGNHVRLDPVWASLAMALSSISVICSSLLLRSSLPIVGFKNKGVDIR